MLDSIKGLIVIFGIAAFVFALARTPVTNTSFSDGNSYVLRRNLWVLLCVIAFVSGNYWLFSILSFAIILATHKRDNNAVALYLALLCAVPAFDVRIPGFGGIESLFTVNHIRILALSLLLPVALKLFRSRQSQGFRSLRTDILFGLFVAWVILRTFMDFPLTQALREAFSITLDMVLPYYVASRYFTSTSQVRESMASYVVVAIVAAVIGMFESVVNWLVYYDLYGLLDLPAGGQAGYLWRDGWGVLRAQASLIHPIVFGYVMMLAVAFLAYLSPYFQPRWKYWFGMLALLGGLFVSMSRGPWVGAFATLILFVLLDPSVVRRVYRTIYTGIAAMIVIFMTPIGGSILENIPFVGSLNAGTVDYRVRLMEVSLEVLADNPLMGNRFYLEDPRMEEMRQGEGIIDVVNTYLQVAMPYGVVGFTLFFLTFLSAIFAIQKARSALSKDDTDGERLGRYLMATLLGIMVTIATVSNIGVIETLYWVVVGICSSYGSVSVRVDQKQANRTIRYGERTQQIPIRY